MTIETRRKPFLAFMILLLAVACDSGSEGTSQGQSDTSNGQDTESLSDGDTTTDSGFVMPASFTNVDVVPDSQAPPELKTVDIESLRDNGAPNSVALISVDGAGAKESIGFVLRTEAENGELSQNEWSYYAYDTDTKVSTKLRDLIRGNYAAISADLSALSWTEECNGYASTVSNPNNTTHLNPLIKINSCVQLAGALSDGGEAGFFKRAERRSGNEAPSENALRPTDAFGPLIYHLQTGQVTSLSGEDLSFGIGELQNVSPELSVTYRHQPFSTNGKLFATQVSFMPTDFEPSGTHSLNVGILLVDTETSEIKLVDLVEEQRIFCDRCARSDYDVVISGNGESVYYLRRTDSELLDTNAVNRLHRYDVISGKVEAVPFFEYINSGSLTVDYFGKNVAFRVGAKPVMLKMDTGEQINMNPGLLDCRTDTCEFDAYRTVVANPFVFSDDGSVLTLHVIPERPDIETPQNVTEAYLLDTTSLIMTRIAPNLDVWTIDPGKTGSLVGISSDYRGLRPDRNDSYYDLFYIER